jgi:hypothetical protein
MEGEEEKINAATRKFNKTIHASVFYFFFLVFVFVVSLFGVCQGIGGGEYKGHHDHQHYRHRFPHQE